MARHGDGASNRHTKRRLSGASSTRSSREADRRARRADAVAENPGLGDAVANGDLGAEQLDAIADAAAKSGGAAASDHGLIDEVKQANPDQARDIARQWLDHHTGTGQLEPTHHRHRRRRKVRTYQTTDGLWALRAEGDQTSIGEMGKQLDALVDAGYQADGGRAVPASQHPRTTDQRRYDALHEQVMGRSGGVPTAGAGRARIHRSATVDDLFGSGTDPATLIGTGPLPAMVLERYWCNADIIDSIYGGDGQPLWQGRAVRAATQAQIDALIARDRGCVLCGAQPSRCEAHHLVPFGAPARGRTDIEMLVLVCGPCHHLIHDSHLTVVRAETGVWTTRPATPDELPSRASPQPRGP